MNKQNTPPKLILRFFRWFCHPDYVEDIEGDLLERNKTLNVKWGKRVANFLIVLEVLKLLRIELIRPLSGFKRMNNFGVIGNNIKTSSRFLKNHKSFTAINLIGLSIGILTSFYALIYVNFELNYDGYHENASDIYRFVTDVHNSNGVKKLSSSIPMAPAIFESFPEIKDYTRIFLDYAIIQSGPETYMRDDYAYVDSTIFSVFSFPLISGNPKNAINITPYDAVLSEKAAKKYFGTIDCIGKPLILDGSTKVYVTAIMQDIPENSHFKVDILLSMKLLTEVWNTNRKHDWKAFDCYTYFQIENAFGLKELNEKLTVFVNSHITDIGTTYQTKLEPLKSVYLHADPRGYRTGTSKAGNITNIYTIGIIGILVLFMASFNFVNLSIALSMNRVKEIGVRKVLGASKSQLRVQFLLDAILLALFSYVLSLTLLWFTADSFNELVGNLIFDASLLRIDQLITMFGLTLLVGFLSGIYPAFFLSNFQSESKIKGKFKINSSSKRVNNYLVISQFVVSVFLVAFTLGVYQQLKYIQHANLGYNKEHKLALDFFFDKNIKNNEAKVRQELTALNGVSQVSFSSSIPGHLNRQFQTHIPNVNGEMNQFTSSVNWIDFEYMNHYEMDIVAGRSFDKDLKSDIGNTMLVNETTAKLLGYQNPNDIIGKPFKQRKNWEGTVIGVVKDFHQFSLRKKIEPMTFQYNPRHYTFTTVTVSNNDVFQTIDELKTKWIEFGASRPFDYHFLDVAYQKQYESENRFGKLIIWFSIITVFISNLGLLGISAFNVSRRTKEIGIRKVLGANTPELLKLIASQFLKLVIIGVIIGVPLSIYGFTNWLENFAYRAPINWWVFMIAGLIMICISFLTIASQVTKTALVNPIKALRDE